MSPDDKAMGAAYRVPTFEQAVEALRGNGLLVYPTETFYALGCSALSVEAVVAVARLKGREMDKPLPLVVGSMEQLRQVTGQLPPALDRLAQAFWPGPLSVVVRALDSLPPQVSDAAGFTAVRLCGHDVARRLCLAADAPLVSTSANMAGQAPAFRPEDIAPDLVRSTSGLLDVEPRPFGGKPSTLVRLVGDEDLEVLRAGAVSVDSLRRAGFNVLGGPGGQDF